MSQVTLFGASSNFYGGTSYGRPVQGAPAMVRAFAVQSVTSRSFVVGLGLKVNKKTMQLNCGNFMVDMFETAEAATKSLARSGQSGASKMKLSEPQKLLITQLKSGATLHHHQDTGLFRLKDSLTTRSMHPATVESMIRAGVIVKSLDGSCRLAQ